MFNDPAPPEIYTLSLHDALPISPRRAVLVATCAVLAMMGSTAWIALFQARQALRGPALARSEEHTSELQSRRDLVCRLLLEKKKMHKRCTPRRVHSQPFHMIHST